MDNKRNIFFFATKELTQDAFLRWLFENYEDPDLENATYSLLTAMCEMTEDEKIVNIETTAQWHHIDISVWIQTNKRKIALFIEDKTFSSEHDQLVTYNKYINWCTKEYGKNIYSVYYKIDIIDEKERSRIEAARTEVSKWKIFTVTQIYELLKDFSMSPNMLVRQYVEYMGTVYNALLFPIKPRTNNTKIDLIQWKAYFDKEIIPKLKGVDDFFWCGSWKAGQYPYIVLHIEKISENKQIPYLEITSRDCIGDHFVSSILTYNIKDDKFFDKNMAFFKEIEDGDKMSHFKPTKQRKTIGKSQRHNNVRSTEDFIRLTNEYVSYYLDLMEMWVSD